MRGYLFPIVFCEPPTIPHSFPYHHTSRRPLRRFSSFSIGWKASGGSLFFKCVRGRRWPVGRGSPPNERKDLEMSMNSNKAARPPIIPFTDEAGRPCLRVPLDPNGNAYAVVLAHHYREIQRAGATGAWFLNDNGFGIRYVRTKVPDGAGKTTMIMVARLIVGAGPRSTIYYQNKDRMDLRPENLFWHRNGRTKRSTIEVVQRGAAYRAARQGAGRQMKAAA